MNDDPSPLATLSGGTLRLRRTFPAPLSEVWRRIATPEGLASWLAPATVDLREGGRITVAFEESEMHGVIERCEPPRLLEYTWVEGRGTTSRVRFELDEQGDGTRLTLTHVAVHRDDLAGVGAGWHTHLEVLRDALRDQPRDFWPLFESLLPEYVKLASSGAPSASDPRHAILG